MNDETMQTILRKIMPPEYVKDMREQLALGKHEDDYFSFEQALFDEINTRKMDEESRKKGGRINVLNSSGDDDKVKAQRGCYRVRGSGDMVGGMAVPHLWLSTEEMQKQEQESRRR